MVQKSPIEHKVLQQDTGTRGGADHRKKLMKVKSMEVSDFNSFKCKKTSSIPIRNYMKPTSSSNSKKEKLQVTVTSPVSNNTKKSPKISKKLNSSSSSSASPRAVKTLSRQSSLKRMKSSMKKSSVIALCARKNVNRATCSSTLKELKFPASLELNHGGNEAEGISKIRVCPYTYCSLNGHIHEPSPSLKCFISARRNLLKTQRSLKEKGLFLFKAGVLDKEGDMLDDELEDEIGENPSDLFVDIYTMSQEEAIGENNCYENNILEEKYHEQCILDEVEYSMETMPQMNESSDNIFEYDYDMDQNSEFSQDEMDDDMMNFQFDHEGTTTAQKDCEENGEIRRSEIETMDMNWEDKTCLFVDNTEISDCSDEQFSANATNIFATSEEVEDDSESEEGNSLKIENEDCNISELNYQYFDDEDEKHPSEMMSFQSDESSLGNESKNPEKDLLNVSATDNKEIGGILSSRWNITKKRTTEEFEQVKEFNPRPPNFLPLEPDPEAEKVDLRHQIMDEKRNSEEWMIDYALQQAVTKLGPARKKKVALLVEAFETVIPLPMCEKPLSHGTSNFNHMSFIQACN